MQTLSRLLIEIYELADEVPIQVFPRELLALLKELVPFDGAILGRGGLDTHTRLQSKPLLASAGHDDSVIVDGMNCIQLWPSLRQYSANTRSVSLCTDCCKCRSAEPPQQLIAQKREVILLAPAQTGDGDWLVLCRRAGHTFGTGGRARLREVWPHVVRSLAINRQRHLNERLREADGRAAAIVTSAGYIDTADPHFKELLSTEWPGFAGNILPPAVMDAWRGAHAYRGTRIEIRFREQHGSLLCIARPHAALVGLTKTEGIVARHFASVLSHREVAQTLGVSENTVRTHLKQAYSKLGVHDKAQLANRIGSPA